MNDPYITNETGAPLREPSPGLAESIPAPGYSDRVNDPEIRAALKKNRTAAGIFALFFVPLPLVGLLVFSLTNDSLETPKALLYGGILSGVFLIFALIGLLRERLKKSYEATVTDKKTATVYRHRNSDAVETVTEYTTVVRTTGGKMKKIVEREGSPLFAYEYLKVGDRFRFHPEFHFPYELYDKSAAPFLACVSCGTRNEITADRCKRCHLPLLR